MARSIPEEVIEYKIKGNWRSCDVGKVIGGNKRDGKGHCFLRIPGVGRDQVLALAGSLSLQYHEGVLTHTLIQTMILVAVCHHVSASIEDRRQQRKEKRIIVSYVGI